MRSVPESYPLCYRGIAAYKRKGMPVMRLEPLYRLTMRYLEGWSVNPLEGKDADVHHFFIAEGRVEGRINGHLCCTNHPTSRPDGTFLPDVQGVIETDDGAVILFDHRGYGRAYPEGARQIIATGTHLSEHPDYRWLNDSVCAGAGEVRLVSPQTEDPDRDWSEIQPTVEIVIEFSELIWEPLDDEVAAGRGT